MKQQKRLMAGIAYMISVPLIGQLGKWYLNDERESAIHEFQSLLKNGIVQKVKKKEVMLYIQLLAKKLIL